MGKAFFFFCPDEEHSKIYVFSLNKQGGELKAYAVSSLTDAHKYLKGRQR